MRRNPWKVAIATAVLVALAATMYTARAYYRTSRLTKQLLSEDIVVRMSALSAMRSRENRKVTGMLIRIIARPESDQRERGIRALVDIGAPAVEPLIEAMAKPHVHIVWDGLYPRRRERSTDVDYWRRLSAARALLMIGDARAVGPMIKLGRYWFESAMVSGVSIEGEMVAGFIRMGEPAVDELFHEYIFCTDTWTSQITMQLLVGIGRAGNVATLVKRLDLVETQSAAVGILSAVGDRRVVPDLVRILRSQTCLDPYVVAEAIRELGGEEAESALAVFDRENKTSDLALQYRQMIQNGGDQALLVYILGRHGSLEMAKDYVLLGGGRLDVCAWSWAKAHGEYQTLCDMIYPPRGTGK